MPIAVQREHGEDAEGGADCHGGGGHQNQHAAHRSFHKLPIVSAGAVPQSEALPNLYFLRSRLEQRGVEGGRRGLGALAFVRWTSAGRPPYAEASGGRLPYVEASGGRPRGRSGAALRGSSGLLGRRNGAAKGGALHDGLAR